MPGNETAVTPPLDRSAMRRTRASNDNDIEQYSALLAELGFAADAPLLLVYTRGTADTAGQLCAAARMARMEVRLLGLPDWDTQRFLRRLHHLANSWPPSATRQGILLTVGDSAQQEAVGLDGFRLVCLPVSGSAPALQFCGRVAALRDSVERCTAELRDRELLLTGLHGEVMVLERCLPLRWRPLPTPASGQLVDWANLCVAYTTVSSACGEFTADHQWQMNRRFRGSTRLAEFPVRLAVSDGTMDRIESADPVVNAFLNRAILVHQVGRVVGVAVGLGLDGRWTATIALAHAGGGPYAYASADLQLSFTSATCEVSAAVDLPVPIG